MRVVVVSRQPLWRDALGVLVAAQLPADPVVALDEVAQLAPLGPQPDDLILLDPPAQCDPGDWLEQHAEQLTVGRLVLMPPHKNVRWAKIAYARGFRALVEKVPKPRNSIRLPSLRASAIVSRIMSTARPISCFC